MENMVLRTLCSAPDTEFVLGEILNASKEDNEEELSAINQAQETISETIRECNEKIDRQKKRSEAYAMVQGTLYAIQSRAA